MQPPFFPTTVLNCSLNITLLRTLFHSQSIRIQIRKWASFSLVFRNYNVPTIVQQDTMVYIKLCLWMVYSLVVRARGLEYGGREFESRNLHLKPETKLREERGLSGCRKGLKTVPLAQALLSLKPAKTTAKLCVPLNC